MFLAFISSLMLEFLVNDDNIAQLANMSMTTPVYALYHSPYCPHCKEVLPAWENFTHLNKENPKVIITQINCIENKKACNYFYDIYSYPTFSIIRNNKSTTSRTNRTIEAWTEVLKKLENYDKDHRCEPWFGLNDNFPSFVITTPYGPEKTCDEVLDLISKVPKSKGLIYTNPEGGDLAIEVFLSKDVGFIFENQTNTSSFISFLQDFVLHPLGDWDLSEAIHSERTIAFFIYENARRLEVYREFALSSAGDILFGKIEFSKFSNLYPEIKLNQSELPVLGISNPHLTKFMILTDIKPIDAFYDRVKNISKGEESELMNYSMAKIFGISETNLTGQSTQRVLIPLFCIAVLCISVVVIFFSGKKFGNFNKKLL